MRLNSQFPGNCSTTERRASVGGTETTREREGHKGFHVTINRQMNERGVLGIPLGFQTFIQVKNRFCVHASRKIV